MAKRWGTKTGTLAGDKLQAEAEQLRKRLVRAQDAARVASVEAEQLREALRLAQDFILGRRPYADAETAAREIAAALNQEGGK